MAKHEVTPEQLAQLDEIFARARAAEKQIENYTQEQVDRMVRLGGRQSQNLPGDMLDGR